MTTEIAKLCNWSGWSDGEVRELAETVRAQLESVTKERDKLIECLGQSQHTAHTYVMNPQLAVCANCGKPATCIGRYEGPEQPVAFACDECCGHGNEDGWCKRLI